ncbi:MAG: sporulation sigma factor SigE, partial [Clostridia bacterium]|nr:sporulation sigma factor SigE [Clostridia bacterium]
MFLKSLINKIILFFSGNRIHYINGNETLPAPLTTEQENEIMAEFNLRPKYVKEKLIVHNLRLVVYIARKFETNTSNLEDLISIGTIGLIKAVNT